ncbi:hypothetical protein ILUMI_25813 [Ignelater luminosus]|uniref:Uncharacterized protein n=1 Tax=Ignelater luminosus TaxID=2038154 RepID=A0A8K0FZA5_IGNLU|nr:hypothetical protein ILUMI_25813 [Ignelater luminosus]
MVVRIENTRISSAKTKKFVGNGLNIHLPENQTTVSVTGNDCRIKIDVNNGVLKVIGNSCKVQVASGNGEIIYNGNEGCIKLGAQVDEKNVTYIGNDGKVFRQVRLNKDNTKSSKEGKKMTGKNSEKPKEEEIPIENTKRNSDSNITLNIVNQSHKRFSLSEGVLSFTVPSVIVVPYVTESVIKIHKAKK